MIFYISLQHQNIHLKLKDDEKEFVYAVNAHWLYERKRPTGVLERC